MKKIRKDSFSFLLLLCHLFFALNFFAYPENPKDYVLYDMQEQFRKLNSDEGFFTVNYFDSKTITQDTFDDKSVRRIYDEDRRLVHKECWAIGSSVEKSQLEYSQDYYYPQDGNKNPEKCITTNLKEKYKTESFFDVRGLKVVEKRFSLEDDYLEEEDSWKYDEKKRVIEEEISVYPKNSKKNIQKNIYSYKMGNEEPDYFFYENGSVRLKRIYENPSDYTETACLDNGFTVETYYKNGIKTEVVQKLNGRTISRVEYDGQ